MKIFVLSDNKVMFKAIKTILSQFSNIFVDYFCSPQSKMAFQHERETSSVSILDVKRNIEFLKKYDLGFSCHCKQIFPDELVKNVRCINVHPGMNPFNRGWYPQVFSIINGYPAGVTIHEMDCQVDHGPIILQEKVEIYPYDTSLSLYNRILNKEIELLEANMEKIILKKYQPIKMVSGGNYNSIKDFNRLCELDLNEKMTMGEAIDKLRALTHEPYSNAFFYDNFDNKIYVSICLEIK